MGKHCGTCNCTEEVQLPAETEQVLELIRKARKWQIKRDNPYYSDDDWTHEQWDAFIKKYLQNAAVASICDCPDEYRREMIKAAAMVVSAVEAYIRANP